MAKNWSVVEALQVITAGKNLGAIRDIGRRFPLFLFFILRNPIKVIEAFGPRMTARTVNKQLEASLRDTTKIVVHAEKQSAELELGEKKKKKEKKDVDEVKVEKAKHATVKDMTEKVDKKTMESKEGKEGVKDKKTKEDDTNDLDFDVEDLLEESED